MHGEPNCWQKLRLCPSCQHPGGSTCEDPASPPPRLNEHMVWLRGKHKQAVDDMFAEMCQCCEELKAIQHAHLEQEGWLMERFLEHEKTQRKQDRQLLERLVSVILSRPQPACPCQHPGME
ncbi:hypothetical protein Y1Q_0001747 [Alligator mississippiensis]|uniref:Uncharacterized protein n=1 Tax=Alligator mississippiensis TaxID=8496 RepID=A0A151P583_ALLMI|nr:hypothetical protein Y1Q_0001747 [Alligator mississippiensis]